MHMIVDEDDYETVITSRPCTTCAGDRRKCFGVGCNGMFGVGSRPRPPHEVRRIKAERERAREDDILAEADRIRAMRSAGRLA